MVSFLNIAFLWGLPLVAVPVIVHLLNRRRQDVVRWGAMQFLLEAVPRRKRIWRLNDLLLMLLRAAIVALFVFALAQPLLRSSLFDSAGPRDVTIVVDASMSTSRHTGNGTVFDELLKKTDELIDDLNDHDTVRVLIAGQPSRWLGESGLTASPAVRSELKHKLRDIPPSLSTVDLNAAVLQAIEAEASDVRARRIITLLTDSQAYGWRAEASAAWKATQDKATAMANAPAINVVTLSPPSGDLSNLAVHSLAASRSVTGAGLKLSFTATIKNHGTAASTGTTLSWSADEKPIGVTVLPALTPGQSNTVTVEHAFDAVGFHRIACAIDRADDLPLDSTARCVVEVAQTVPVLVVDGNPRARDLRSDTAFVMAALGRSPADEKPLWRSVFQPKLVNVEALPNEKLADYRCVILANVSSLDATTLQALTIYTRAGGGVWLAPGDLIDRAAFNDTFARPGGFSPLPITEPVGNADDREKFVEIEPPSPDHPATRLLSDTQRMDIDRARIYRRYPFDKPTGTKDLAVLLRTLDGKELAIENHLGRGRVIVQGVPLGIRWTNLPACQAFVVMVNEWLWRLAEPSMTRTELFPGETFVFPASGSDKPTIETKSPSGASVPVTTQLQDGRNVYTTAAHEPGDYTLTIRTNDKNTATIPFHVQRDVEESNLSTLNDEDRQALTAAGLNFTNDGLYVKPDSTLARPAHPAWAWLLALLVILLALESFIAGRLTQQRYAPAPAIRISAVPMRESMREMV